MRRSGPTAPKSHFPGGPDTGDSRRGEAGPYGKSIAGGRGLLGRPLRRLASSITVRELCLRVEIEFERRLAAGEISLRHASSMRETLKKSSTRFGGKPVKLISGTEIKAWFASESLIRENAEQTPGLRPERLRAGSAVETSATPIRSRG